MKENDVTTLNAKANTAYNDLIAKTERENPGDVWAGFEGDQDAFETGFEAGYEAAPVVDREALVAVLRQHIFRNFGTFNGVVDDCTDAVMALLNGGAK